MANQARMNVGVKFNVDRSSISSVKQALNELSNIQSTQIINNNDLKKNKEQLIKIQEEARIIGDILEDSFNAKLGTVNLDKVNKKFKEQKIDVVSLGKTWSTTHAASEKAYRSLLTVLTSSEKYTKQTSEWLDKMAKTLGNTVRWSISSTAINAITGSVEKAYNFTKKLDESLNDIVIVTGKGTDEMARFAKEANKVAKNLGAMTTDYTKASLIYYQQGLSDEEVRARSETTVKVANVTGTNADQASEQLTAIWNGYKANAQEAELYIDKVSAVAAKTAADLEELSTGMSRVASAANIMGVDIDQLNAQVATIVSVTREAPESIGTALKTVYARMSDIQAGLDTETTLGEYTSQMAEMGFNVLTAEGNLRDMGDVVEEIGNKWNTLNREQQTSLAQTIAGTRQYSRMMSLFDNWTMYQEALNTSRNAEGTLNEQNERYMESMEAHLNQLQAAADGLYDTLLDPEDLNKIIDLFTKLVEKVDLFVQGLGGGTGLLQTLGSLGLSIFDSQIAKGIGRAVTNTKGLVSNLKQAKYQAENIELLLKNENLSDDSRQTLEMRQQLLKVSSLLDDKEKEIAESLIKQREALSGAIIDAKQRKAQADELYSAINPEDTESLNSNTVEAQKNIKESLVKQNQEIQETVKGLGNATKQMEEILKKQKQVADQRRTVGNRKGLITRNKNKEPIVADPNQPYEQSVYSKLTTQDKYDEWQLKQEKFELSWQKGQEQLDQYESELKESLTFFNENYNGENFGYIDSLIEKLKIFKNTAVFTEEERANIDSVIKTLNQGISTDKETGKQTLKPEKVKETSEALKEALEYAEKISPALKDGAKAQEEFNDIIKEAEEATKKADQAFKDYLNSFDTAQAIKSVVQLGSAIGSVGNIINNIQSIGSIWDNDNLSGWEKAFAIISSVSTSLGMAYNAYKTATESMAGFNEVIINIAARKKASDEAAAAAAQKQAAAEAAKKQAQEAANRETREAVVTNKQAEEAVENHTEEVNENSTALGINTKLQTANNISKSTSESPLTNDISDAIPKKGGNIKEKFSNWKTKNADSIAGLKAVAPYLIAISLAIAGIAAAVKIVDNHINKEAKALEKATAQVKAFDSAVTETQKELKEIQEAANKYDELQTSLDTLTKGTKEWNKALHESNEQILTLIDKYPELAAFVQTGKHGELEIKEDGLRLLESNKIQEAATLASAKNSAKIAELEAKNEVAEDELSQALTSGGDKGLVGGASAAGGLGGATIAALIAGGILSMTGIGTAAGVAIMAGAALGAGAASGAGLGTLTHQSVEDMRDEEAARAIELYNKDNSVFNSVDSLAIALGGNTDSNRELAERLLENKDALIEAANEQRKNTEAMNIYRDQQALNYIKSQGLSVDYENATARMLQEELYRIDKNSEDNEYYEAARESIGNLTKKEQKKAYAELMGYTFVSGNKYRDAEGKEIKVDLETVRDTLIDQEALQLVTQKNLNKITADLDKVTSSINKEDKAGREAAANLAAGIELTDLSSVTYESIQQLGELANRLSGVSANSKAVISDINNEFNLLNEKIKESVGISLESLNSLTFAEMEAFTSLMSVAGVGEEENDIQKLFSTVLTAAGEDSQDELAKLVANTDWLDKDAKEDFVNQFKELGISLENTGTSAEEFAETIITIKEAQTYSIDELIKKSTQLFNIINSVKQAGDTISEDEFNSLSSQMQSYFVRMADGTYMLTESAASFYKLTAENRRTIFLTALSGLKEKEDEKEKRRQEINKELSEIEELNNREKNNNKFTTDIQQYLSLAGKNGKTIYNYSQESYDADTADNRVKKMDKEQLIAAVTLIESTYDSLDPEFQSAYPNMAIVADGSSDAIQSLTDPKQDPFVHGLQILGRALNEYAAARSPLTPQEQAKINNQTALEKELEDLNKPSDVNKESLELLDSNVAMASNEDEAKNLIKDYLASWKGDNVTDADVEALYNSRGYGEKYFGDTAPGIPSIEEANRDAHRKMQISEIDRQLESKEKELDTLSSLADDLTGQDLLENLNKQYELQQDILSTEEERLKVIAELAKGKDSELFTSSDFVNATDILEQRAGKELDESQLFQFNEDGTLNTAAIQNYLQNFTSGISTSYQAETGTQIDTIISAIEEFNGYATEAASKPEELAQRAKEYFDYVMDGFNKTLDSINNKFQRRINMFETLTNMHESQAELMELMGHSESEIAAETAKTQEYNKAILESYKEEYNWKKQLYEDSLVNPEKYTEEMRESIEDDYFSIAETVMDQANTIAQNALDEYKRQLNSLEDWFRQTFFGDINLDLLKLETDWTREISNRSFDAIDTEYQIGKVNYQFREAMNEFKGQAAAQNKLNSARERELTILRSRDKLTQTDIDRANKRLELEKARIALEEAQANKTRLQLVRGSDGAYSYQYISDEEEIADKKQQILDLENELYNIDKEALQNTMDEAYSAYKTFFDQLTQLAEDGLSSEEQNYLSKLWADIGDQIDTLYGAGGPIEAMAASMGLTADEFERMMTSGAAFSSGIPSQLASLLQDMSFKDLSSSDLTTIFDKVTSAWSQYQGTVNEVATNNFMATVLDDVTKAALGEDGKTGGAKGAIDELNTSIDELTGEEALKGWDALIQKAKDFVEQVKLIPNIAVSVVDTTTEEPAPSTPSTPAVGSGGGGPFGTRRVLMAYDTGGYTGEWGTDGRIAMLHEKELVLNKDDTLNILKTVEFVRSMQDALDTSLAGMMAQVNMSNNNLMAHSKLESTPIQQTVQINAEFPDATDAAEIKEAFNDLLNLATQYVYEDSRFK